MTSHRIKPSEFAAPLLLACAVFLLFLKGPGLGDDFSYWRIGFDIHESGLEGWNPKSFHNLRWPIWGLCWVLQGVLGFGPASFYGVPLFYLLLATGAVYFLARRFFLQPLPALGATFLFLCHPLLDPVISRPMPDLSEGTFIALAVLMWVALVESKKGWSRSLWALGIGVTTGLLFANRITGVFVFGVLVPVAGVMAWKNERFTYRQTLLWLAVVGALFLSFIAIEALIYQRITGDFFHSYHANLGARGRKGTDSVPLYQFPFRFLGVLWKSGRLAPFYFIATLLGIGVLWQRPGRLGKVIVVWAISLYLAYSCSLQSISPPRPLLRDADRFLCSLALPFSILAMAGGLFTVRLLGRLKQFSFLKSHRLAGVRGLAVFMVALLALVLFQGRRSLFETGFLPQLSHYLDTLPEGTRIFTHRAMRGAAFLANNDKAGKMEWYAPSSIFNYKQKHETEAAKADQFWYCRKISWLSTRKQLEGDGAEEQKRLGSYFVDPTEQWSLQRAIQVGGVPEFILYARRTDDAPSPKELSFNELIPSGPPLPYRWERPASAKKGKSISKQYKFPVPEQLRGKALQVRLTAHSSFVQATKLTLDFYNGEEALETLSFRPYFHPTPAVDFHTFEIPAEATRCVAKFVFPPKAKDLTVSDFTALLSP